METKKIEILDKDGKPKTIEVPKELAFEEPCTQGEEKCWEGNVLKCNSQGKWYDTGRSC